MPRRVMAADIADRGVPPPITGVGLSHLMSQQKMADNSHLSRCPTCPTTGWGKAGDDVGVEWMGSVYPDTEFFVHLMGHVGQRDTHLKNGGYPPLFSVPLPA